MMWRARRVLDRGIRVVHTTGLESAGVDGPVARRPNIAWCAGTSQNRSGNFDDLRRNPPGFWSWSR